MQFNLNRREFVGGAAALAAAGCCCAKPTPRYGGTGKIRLAVAGVMGVFRVRRLPKEEK